MKALHASVILAMLLVACSSSVQLAPDASATAVGPDALQPVSAFTGIRDRRERSAALFTEASRVLQHPRCLNCHPQGRMPTQGDDLHPHVPMMQATDVGHGVPALQCNTCHSATNVATQVASVRSMPGHAHWMLAPAAMAWQGLTAAQVCAQIKDPARNGGRSLAAIHEHLAEDSLVGWAWHPGEGRTPAPGTQHEFGELVAAWIETGAVCPAR